jgi:hypothetical protein
MKKIFALAIAALFITKAGFADDDTDKKVRFGLKITPTPTWLRSGDTKLVDKSGVKFGFGFGLQLEFRLGNTACFVTGVGGDFLGGKQTYKNGQGLVLTSDGKYVKSADHDFGDIPSVMASTQTLTTNNKIYEIKSRSVKSTYITIPILLKLKTKDINHMKYFGMFGGNIAIQTKYQATEELSELNYNSSTGKYESGATTTFSGMKPSGDLIPFNIALNVGLGFEYNLSGSTSFFMSANYIRGFFNTYQGTSDFLVEKIKDNINSNTPANHDMKPDRAKQSAFSGGVQINLGFLF